MGILIMSCCSSCLRFLLTVSNLVLAVLGLLMLGGGVWLTVDQGQVEDIFGKLSNYTKADIDLPEGAQETFDEVFKHEYFTYLLIGIGAVTFLVWFLWGKEGVSVSYDYLHNIHHPPYHHQGLC